MLFKKNAFLFDRFCLVFDALSILHGSFSRSFSDAGRPGGKRLFVLRKSSFRPAVIVLSSCDSSLIALWKSWVEPASIRILLVGNLHFTLSLIESYFISPQSFLSPRNSSLIAFSSSCNPLPALHLCQPMALRALYAFCIGRVQERKKSDLYPYRARKMAEVGYRRKKMVICTLKRQEKWQKPGTGEEK